MAERELGTKSNFYATGCPENWVPHFSDDDRGMMQFRRSHYRWSSNHVGIVVALIIKSSNSSSNSSSMDRAEAGSITSSLTLTTF